MRARSVLAGMLAVLVVVALPPAAQAGGVQTGAGKAAAEADISLDLPVSIERIRTLLEDRPAFAATNGGLRLNIQVRVFAPAPPIDVFQGFDVDHSPPRYGTPVHAELATLNAPSRLRFRNGTPAVTTGHALSWGRR